MTTRKIELEQSIDDSTLWKWKILVWEGGWVTIKYGVEEGYDEAVRRAKKRV